MARSRKKFSIGSLIMCLIVLICCVGLCVAEYYDLFTDNLIKGKIEGKPRSLKLLQEIKI